MNWLRSTRIRLLRRLAITMLVLIALLLALSPVLAQDEPPGGEADAGAAAGASGAVYAGSWEREVGVEYVGDYPYCCRSTGCGWSKCDLPNAANNAHYFRNYLRWYGGACTVGKCFIYGNANAWEEDFKRHDWGGTNNYYVDAVDIVFYEGHGNPSLFTFEKPTGPGTHDDSYLRYQDARLSWGDNDAEYVALLSCSVLADSHQTDWSWAMNRLHLLLGFKNTAYDVKWFGYNFAKRLVQGYRVYYAWFKACDTHQPPGTTAKVLAEHPSHWYDTWYNRYPDSWDYYYHVKTHPCGSQSPWAASVMSGATVQQEDPTSLPVFSTPALSLAEANAKWDSLTDAFELPQGDLAAMQGNDYYETASGGRDLEMDTSNGLYYYVDTNLLFSDTTPSGVHVLSSQDAKDIADQFLSDSGLMPGDAQFNTVLEEVEETVEVPGRALGVRLGASNVVQQTVTDYQVAYTRILSYATTVQQGDTTVQQINEIEVSGPGSKLNVYVDAGGGPATVAADGAVGAVAGAQGGWRSIDQGLAAQAVVPLLPFDPQVEQLFLGQAHRVALEQVPFDNPTSVTILGHQVVLWEEPTGTGQAELYPAYEILATFVNAETEVTDSTWIPANERYMRPLAMIESHSDTGKNFVIGDVFTATAVDASQQLADLGFHESLTFTLGSNLPGSYLYDWYVGSVHEDNKIGSGRDLEYPLSTVKGTDHAVPVPQTIILQVTDLFTPHSGQNTSTASVEMYLVPPVYVPTVMKNYQ